MSLTQCLSSLLGSHLKPHWLHNKTSKHRTQCGLCCETLIYLSPALNSHNNAPLLTFSLRAAASKKRDDGSFPGTHLLLQAVHQWCITLPQLLHDDPQLTPKRCLLLTAAVELTFQHALVFLPHYPGTLNLLNDALPGFLALAPAPHVGPSRPHYDDNQGYHGPKGKASQQEVASVPRGLCSCHIEDVRSTWEVHNVEKITQTTKKNSAECCDVMTRLPSLLRSRPLPYNCRDPLAQSRL